MSPSWRSRSLSDRMNATRGRSPKKPAGQRGGSNCKLDHSESRGDPDSGNRPKARGGVKALSPDRACRHEEVGEVGSDVHQLTAPDAVAESPSGRTTSKVPSLSSTVAVRSII